MDTVNVLLLVAFAIVCLAFLFYVLNNRSVIENLKIDRNYYEQMTDRYQADFMNQSVFITKYLRLFRTKNQERRFGAVRNYVRLGLVVDDGKEYRLAYGLATTNELMSILERAQNNKEDLNTEMSLIEEGPDKIDNQKMQELHLAIIKNTEHVLV